MSSAGRRGVGGGGAGGGVAWKEERGRRQPRWRGHWCPERGGGGGPLERRGRGKGGGRRGEVVGRRRGDTGRVEVVGLWRGGGAAEDGLEGW